MNHTVVKAISGIKESARTPIHYPNAIRDEDEQRLDSDAEVAEVPFTAFTSRRKADHISGRLIVRRVRRLNPKPVSDGQGELFPDYRHHGVFTGSPLTMLQAEKTHRAHAIVEQVIADLKSGALAQLPSGSFAANSAWLVLAVMAFNLPAPPAPSRRSSTPKPPPPRSAGHSSWSQAASPGQPGNWSYTYQRTGPGKTAGRGSSTRPAGHQPPEEPDHPAPTGRNQGLIGKAGQTGGYPTTSWPGANRNHTD